MASYTSAEDHLDLAPCVGCHKVPIDGFLWVCKTCDALDICRDCALSVHAVHELHDPTHDILPVSAQCRATVYETVQIMQCVRQLLNSLSHAMLDRALHLDYLEAYSQWGKLRPLANESAAVCRLLGSVGLNQRLVEELQSAIGRFESLRSTGLPVPDLSYDSASESPARQSQSQTTTNHAKQEAKPQTATSQPPSQPKKRDPSAPAIRQDRAFGKKGQRLADSLLNKKVKEKQQTAEAAEAKIVTTSVKNISNIVVTTSSPMPILPKEQPVPPPPRSGPRLIAPRPPPTLPIRQQ